jgi:hypothetical protein
LCVGIAADCTVVRDVEISVASQKLMEDDNRVAADCTVVRDVEISVASQKLMEDDNGSKGGRTCLEDACYLI